MIRIIVLIAVLFVSQHVFAQVRATTESGNKVLLLDDGTWRYEEKTVHAKAETTVAVAPAKISAEAEPALIAIDSAKELSTEYSQLFYLPSPRLVRFFGEEKGKIRCSVGCSNNKGEIAVNYMWEFPVGDGTRYYGFFKAGSKMILHLQSGEKVELLVAEDSKIKAMEKYNITGISGTTQALTQAQLATLLESAVLKMEVEWKKKNESYDLDFSNFFKENLPKVF